MKSYIIFIAIIAVTTAVIMSLFDLYKQLKKRK
jgi:hypothetical protein